MPIERKSTGDDPIATTAKTKARLEVRQAKLKDVPEIAELVRRAYADLPPYTLGEIRGQLNNYREGCFVAKGKDDALVTRNMVVGESVYGEKRISVEQNEEKIEYRVWNPFRSKVAASIVGGGPTAPIRLRGARRPRRRGRAAPGEPPGAAARGRAVAARGRGETAASPTAAAVTT